MAYYVNKTDGTAILVLDGTKDEKSSTSLTLVGRLATNYGEVQNENFVALLENFAFGSPPVNPITGQLWFDTQTNTVKVRKTDSTWIEVGSNLDNIYLSGNLYTAGNVFQIVGTDGNITVTNNSNNKNLIFRSNVSGTLTNVLNIDGSSGLITVAASPTANLGVATKNYVDGLESNVNILLNNVYANLALINSNISSINSNVANTNSSLTGLSSNVTSGSGDVNANAVKIRGNTVITASGTGNTVVNFLTPEGLTFLSAYGTGAGNLVTVSGNWTLSAGSTLNSSYADLAEYYSSDESYEAGTVVIFGGSSEVTTTNKENDTRLAGVISTNPAYIMNTALEKNRVCVALQGRVPCKVIGPVTKGDLLTTSATSGFAIKAQNPVIGAIIGKSLENNDTYGPCIVEVSISRS